MPEKLLIAIISVAGIALSSLLSYLIGKKKAQLEMIALKEGYTQKLFDKRIECYPELYQLLSDFSKKIRRKKANSEELSKFISKVEEWDSKYAIYLSPVSVMNMIKFLSLARSLEGKEFSQNKCNKLLIPKIVSVEMSLKTELGVFEAEGHHRPPQVAVLRDEIEKLQQNEANN